MQGKSIDSLISCRILSLMLFLDYMHILVYTRIYIINRRAMQLSRRDKSEWQSDGSLHEQVPNAKRWHTQIAGYLINFYIPETISSSTAFYRIYLARDSLFILFFRCAQSRVCRQCSSHRRRMPHNLHLISAPLLSRLVMRACVRVCMCHRLAAAHYKLDVCAVTKCASFASVAASAIANLSGSAKISTALRNLRHLVDSKLAIYSVFQQWVDRLASHTHTRTHRDGSVFVLWSFTCCVVAPRVALITSIYKNFYP